MNNYGSIICSKCGKETQKTTTANQKYCPDCRKLADKERKSAFHKKSNPNQAPAIKHVKCSVCENPFSSSFEGVPYCNKHYMKMYKYGTLYPVRKKRNSYIIADGVVTMYSTKGESFIIDEADLDKVFGSTWCFNKSGRYLVATINKKVVRLHRFILDVDGPDVVVDHINGDPSDNRRCNLRITTQKHNSRNVRASKDNKVGYPGIDRKPNGRYRARITVDRKEIQLGVYDTIEEAKRARVSAEEKYYGEFSPSKGVLK